MTDSTDQDNRSSHYDHNPLLLRVYLYYRFVLALLLYVMFVTGLAQSVLGKQNPVLYEWVSITYCLICFGSLFVFRPRLLRHSLNRISFLLIIDLLAILLIIHASGGPGGGLGYLLIFCVATAGLFIRGQMSLSFAALTSFFVIGESIYIGNKTGKVDEAIFTAGTLGILIFATAIIFHYLTDRIRKSEIFAAAQATQVRQLQQLAENIITRMRTGVIVINEKNILEFINRSAAQLLDVNPDDNHFGSSLENFPKLQSIVASWRRNPVSGIPWHHEIRPGLEIRVNFAYLEESDQRKIILYLEDYRAIAQQAQQLKLASLGRLTASIAHEVRNPLGAIAHAAQLLSESTNIQKGDIRLTEIILQHSDRVNQIIENTMVLSRRKEPKPKVIALEQFLPGFVDSFTAAQPCEVDLHISPSSISIKMDATHLSQILTNLCENGARYSKATTGKAHIALVAGISKNDEVPFIEVIDDGPGIADDALNQIFDPFYTTDEKGSGLGLYISRELCEINQASLFFQRNQEGKSCFRVNLSHHQRMI